MPYENLNPDAQGEILGIAKSNNGKVTAEQVIASARYKKSHLHSYFEWDDEKAAHKHRLETARRLIRAVVVTNTSIPPRVIKPLWSLPPDREKGTYRTIDAIAKSDVHMEAMEKMALTELESWCHRFESVREIYPLVVSVRNDIQHFMELKENRVPKRDRVKLS